MVSDNKTYFWKLNENGQNNNFWNIKGELEYVDQWFLMESPIPLMMITMCYLMFVLKLGPAYMKSRQPYDLRKFLVFYNFGQVIMSIIVFYLGLNLMIPNGLVLRKCLVSDELRRRIAAATYYYFICKILELLDTIIFVLRKKQNQVSFLHVYHHTMMMCTTWTTLKLEPTYTPVFLGTLNSFVHIVMYTYYTLSAFPELTKYLWWKKYITAMQLVQFLIVLLQAIGTYIISECKPSYILGAQIILNAILFLFLFGDFYLQSYIKNNRNNSADAENTEIRDKSNYIVTTCEKQKANGIKYRNGTIKIEHN